MRKTPEKLIRRKVAESERAHGKHTRLGVDDKRAADFILASWALTEFFRDRDQRVGTTRK